MSREYDEKLRAAADMIRSDFETATGDALAEKEAAKAELRATVQNLKELQTLRGALDAAREEIETERNRSTQLQFERDQLAREFDGKLQHIVNGMAADHENTMGDMLIEKSSARAEMRTMNQKMQEMSRTVEEERRRTAAEKAARERLEAEWNEKLQTIVTHLTEDHEADVGEAILAKEGAARRGPHPLRPK